MFPASNMMAKWQRNALKKMPIYCKTVSQCPSFCRCGHRCSMCSPFSKAVSSHIWSIQSTVDTAFQTAYLSSSMNWQKNYELKQYAAKKMLNTGRMLGRKLVLGVCSQYKSWVLQINCQLIAFLYIPAVCYRPFQLTALPQFPSTVSVTTTVNRYVIQLLHTTSTTDAAVVSSERPV